ncbi:cyclic nucleotide-binding domain-containing protein [Sphingorhabdus sp. Alg239-R122]|uniref:Crp/Fnr family transcriptional regulator n=1 Tax=Sphingorhabdus sp. Alg239-R122 TaxID=2305989 RepID=UPI0013DB9166|nr:cyclic nucleotide-binding domain-containing protein [Sphingorhabdus sp. Alg239-R122]
MFTDLSFTGGGWLGQLSLLLLLAAMLVKPALKMRMLVMLSGLVGAVFAVSWLNDYILAAWQLALALVCGVMVLVYFLQQSKVSFTGEEESLRAAFLGNVPRSSARHLIDQGNWIDGRKGEVLIHENEATTHLFYIENGSANVAFDGKPVGTCGSGDLVGDATALSGEPASGTVTLNEDSRMWCIAAPELRAYVKLHDDVRPAIERHINAALQQKLQAVNEKVAGT